MPTKLSILMSLVLHVAVCVAITQRHTESTATSATRSSVSTRISTNPPELPALPAPKPIREETPPAAAKELAAPEPASAPPARPVKYAGAPPKGEDEKTSPVRAAEKVPEKPAVESAQAEKDPLPSTNPPVVSAAAGNPQENLKLPLATSVRKEGLQAPSFQISGLDVPQINRIVGEGQAIVVVMCDDDVYAVEGPLNQPTALRIVRKLPTFSERALFLRADDGRQALERLHWEYAVSGQRLAAAKVCLLLVNQVDHLILQRQLAAVATANVKVELVESTRGQFVFNGQRIVDFDVSGQQLRDGRFIAAAPQAANAGSPGR